MAVELIGAGFTMNEILGMDLVTFGGAAASAARNNNSHTLVEAAAARTAYHADKGQWKSFRKSMLPTSKTEDNDSQKFRKRFGAGGF